ncbi:MAG: DUF3737 family protein [Clostridia bacterium]|nr:DUF3737 family protein [Clostridia bacterium]
MKQITQGRFKGERSLFASSELRIDDAVFEDGESPLKESRDIELHNCLFKWKYPLWYCDRVTADKCVLFEYARAAIWYSNDVEFNDTVIEAPKAFRRCKNVKIRNVAFHNADETLWQCEGVSLENVGASHGAYFGMNCDGVEVDGLTLSGNYAFDGAKNVTVKNSRLITKDAFWNGENVTVSDSFISGEYLGWNSKDLTFINCTIESLQGMCYIDNLKMINCRLINTTLAFEYSSVEAELTGCADSVFNPGSGIIKAERIGELIIERDIVDPSKTKIICKNIGKTSDRPEWKL